MTPYQQIRISVVGDCGIDNFTYCKIIKPSTEAPVMVVRKSAIINCLGLSSNVANNLRALGVKVQLCGIGSNDYFGSKLKGLLREQNIEDSLIIDRRPTIVKTRYIAINQQLLRVDTEIERPIRDDIAEELVKNIKIYNPDVIVVSDYAKGVVTDTLMKGLKNLGKGIIANPKPQNIFLYSDVDTMQLNKAEANQALRMMKVSGEDYKKILDNLRLNCLVVTRGAEGIWIYTKDKFEKIDAVAKKVVDVSGCGDTVLAVIAVERHLKTPIVKIGLLGNEAAASVIERLGTHRLDLDKLLQMRNNIIK